MKKPHFRGFFEHRAVWKGRQISVVYRGTRLCEFKKALEMGQKYGWFTSFKTYLARYDEENEDRIATVLESCYPQGPCLIQ